VKARAEQRVRTSRRPLGKRRASTPAGTPLDASVAPDLQPGPEQAGSTERSFRPDLEGLRGVAILLVLLFHAGLPGMGGGFVGVDVFFVLSGFLITGILVRERERTGRIGLRAFYARRARRILPAGAVFVALTLIASAFVLDPLRLTDVARDGVAAALSVPNIRFALNAMDYFQSGSPPSPLLHYWSLGVEEQFYLLWPAMLLLALRLPRRRLAASLLLVTVVIGSYLVAFYLTTASAQWAFYSLPARAWQLALGGLIAVIPLQRLPQRVLTIVSWVGLIGIVAAGVTVDPASPYPGLAALLPTLGAGAVVLGGDRPWSVGTLLAVPPLRFFGRISYSLYLAHWPILVLPAANLAIGEQLPLEIRGALALVSVVVACASYLLVERPFLRGMPSGLRLGRTLAAAGATIAAMVVLAAGTNAYASWRIDEAMAANDSEVVSSSVGSSASSEEGDESATSGSTSGSSDGSVVDDAPGGEHRPVMSGGSATKGQVAVTSPGLIPKPTARPRPPAPAPVGPQPLPRGVRPSLADARGDDELLLHNGCTLGYAGIQPPACEFGDPRGPTVVLVGDSHASQWFPALVRIAQDRHWRLVTLTKLSCRFFDLPMFSRELDRRYTECESWRALVVSRLVALRPKLTIVAAARGPQMLTPEDDNPARQGIAMARLLNGVPGKIAIMADTPESHFRVPECISGHLADTRACETARSFAFGWRRLLLEQAAAKALGARIVDLAPTICPRDPCPVVLNGMIVYRDDHHMTATFAASLASVLSKALPDPAPRPPAPAPKPVVPSPTPKPVAPTPVASAPPVLSLPAASQQLPAHLYRV
jgi:peptidoglycan/LPS O-acetylase OafA/YrhL